MTDAVETMDAFLGGRIVIAQPAHGYRAGIDAVFLAAVCGGSGRVLDVGAGAGTVGLCVARRCGDANVVLLEREPQLAAMAAGNVERNGLWPRVLVATLAVGATVAELAAHDLAANSFDHVLANPPYHDEGRGTAAPDTLKAMSHAMPEAGLDDWVRFMARMAKSGGAVSLIQKAEALPDVLAAYSGRFGAICILPLYPRDGEPASRVLVKGIKGSRAPLVMLPGFVLHDCAGNSFTPAAQAVLRDGAGVPMG